MRNILVLGIFFKYVLRLEIKTKLIKFSTKFKVKTSELLVFFKNFKRPFTL